VRGCKSLRGRVGAAGSNPSLRECNDLSEAFNGKGSFATPRECGAVTRMNAEQTSVGKFDGRSVGDWDAVTRHDLSKVNVGKDDIVYSFRPRSN
jgi:hypothetical protein